MMDYTIKEIRHFTGLTQRAFAAQYHIPPRTVEDWERGVRECPGYVVELLALATGYKTKAELHMDVQDLYNRFDLQPLLRCTAMQTSGPDIPYFEITSRDHSVDALIPDGCYLAKLNDVLYLVRRNGTKRPVYPDDFTTEFHG